MVLQLAVREVAVDLVEKEVMEGAQKVLETMRL